MATPVRLQAKRTRGFRLQEHSMAVNGLPALQVTRPSLWGNPFIMGKPSGCEFKDGGDPTPMIPALTLDQCIVFFEDAMSGFLSPEMHPHGHEWVAKWRQKMNCHPVDWLPTLRGKNLACSCALDAKCHADVLIRRANPPSAWRTV